MKSLHRSMIECMILMIIIIIINIIIIIITLRSIFFVWKFPALGIRIIFITQHISVKLGLE